MAYDRAPRPDLLGTGQTGPNVSPNSYQKPYNDSCTCKGSNWAPFLVCSGRKSATHFITPAPNEYYPKLCKKIPGGASMLYTEKRFRWNWSLIPGPQEYDPYNDEEYLDDEPPPRLKGFLYHCNNPYTLKGYCPTIPNTWHSGYDTMTDGTLVECCYPDNDTTLGPAFYNVNYHTFGTCYRGSYWSRYSRRKTKETSDTPGVGSYDVQPKPNEMQEYLLKLREERQKTACVLRYMEKLQNDAIRNNFPAPNQYSAFKLKKCECVKKKTVPKKVVKIREFERQLDTTPGPNEYMDPRTAFWYLKKPSCLKELNAFLTNAPRFKKGKRDRMPAPNQYALKSFVDEMKGKISPYAVRDKVAFDTSVRKKLYYLPPDYPPIILKKPCKCSSYPREPESPVPPPHPTYPFASKTKRFKTYEVNYEASPASYNIGESFKSISERKSFRKAQKYNFLVGEKRFAKITNFNVEEDKSDLPFLKYNLVPDARGWTCGCIFERTTFNRQERFLRKKEHSPGPLDYRVPRYPSVRTFNVTLNPPSKTPYQLYKIKTRKRAFDPNAPRKVKKLEKVCPDFVPKVFIQVPIFQGQGKINSKNMKNSEKRRLIEN